jgi:uncharacterized protein YegJ (DUF2314 family)
MPKLLMQIAVATAVWFGLGCWDIHWGIRILAIVGGGTCVHQFWERVMFNPYAYLGAMPIANDDPIMLKAVARARETLSEFRSLQIEHKEDSMVKFRFTTDSGAVEGLWGDLLEMGATTVKVYVRTPPLQHSGTFERTMTVSTDDITDWQVELHDGTLRGGFTNQAVFRIFERQEGYVHPKFREHMKRFQDALSS